MLCLSKLCNIWEKIGIWYFSSNPPFSVQDFKSLWIEIWFFKFSMIWVFKKYKEWERKKNFQKKYKYFSCWLSQKNRRFFLVDFNLIMAELVQVIHNIFILISHSSIMLFCCCFNRKCFLENRPIFFGCLVVTLKIGRIYLSWFIEYVTFWNTGLVFCWITFSSVPNTQKKNHMIVIQPRFSH